MATRPVVVAGGLIVPADDAKADTASRAMNEVMSADVGVVESVDDEIVGEAEGADNLFQEHPRARLVAVLNDNSTPQGPRPTRTRAEHVKIAQGGARRSRQEDDGHAGKVGADQGCRVVSETIADELQIAVGGMTSVRSSS
jgi:hypothetical protein